MSESTKCACPDCICQVSKQAVTANGKHYCSEVCANHHSEKDTNGCEDNCHCQCGKAA